MGRSAGGVRESTTSCPPGLEICITVSRSSPVSKLAHARARDDLLQAEPLGGRHQPVGDLVELVDGLSSTGGQT